MPEKNSSESADRQEPLSDVDDLIFCMDPDWFVSDR